MKHTDRELLGVAAKAAEIVVVRHEWTTCRIDKLGASSPPRSLSHSCWLMGFHSYCGQVAPLKEKNRKEMLMAYGNAIVPQAGAHVIKAFMEYAT